MRDHSRDTAALVDLVGLIRRVKMTEHAYYRASSKPQLDDRQAHTLPGGSGYDVLCDRPASALLHKVGQL